MSNTYGDETCTSTTLAATTWTEVADAVLPPYFKVRELWNESGAEIRFVFQTSAPTLATEGRPLADESAYIAEAKNGASTSKLWCYSTPGGVVTYVQG